MRRTTFLCVRMSAGHRCVGTYLPHGCTVTKMCETNVQTGGEHRQHKVLEERHACSAALSRYLYHYRTRKHRTEHRTDGPGRARQANAYTYTYVYKTHKTSATNGIELPRSLNGVKRKCKSCNSELIYALTMTGQALPVCVCICICRIQVFVCFFLLSCVLLFHHVHING